ncbi:MULTISPECIES: DUF1284 domain-containing protein [unclassified Halomonas]|uniref:DUF1284 domain-containing protein n=1 Tax=unclassified Halomonas TaxID=2609666 RepID=UPI0020A1E458|nr:MULTISPECIES: DUF1284 domain-containing protein [unclassified Halomonas]MCP1315647.1 DUF1284 domain-containing protein [Halomonas sp. 707D7]MCP1326132.1 DUF1284 domain-containing protein [Halomonas sp. 707D4]
MTIRLRGHHLLCLLTYVGKGYSAAFVANYDRLAARLSGGEPVKLVAGPDDICAPLFTPACEPPHCLNHSVIARDAAALEAISETLGRSLTVGDTLELDNAMLASLRVAFRAGRTRRACVDCQWHALCTGVAESDYAGARVQVG